MAVVLAASGAGAFPESVAAETPRWNLAETPRIGDTVHDIGGLAFGSLEVSGVVLSRTRVDVFWALQDNRTDLLVAFNTAGSLVQAVTVTGMDSEDLEDIAADLEGRLYLADTGTNLRPREEVRVLQVREPEPGAVSAAVERSWSLRWPDAGRDCESLVIHDGYGWLVAKVRAPGQATTLARFRLDDPGPVITLQVMGDLAIASPAAAADLTPDGSRFALSTPAGVYSWNVGGNPAYAVSRAPWFSLSSPGTKKEGLAFVPQGLLVVTETGDRYLDVAPQTLPPDPGPRLHFGPAGVPQSPRLEWTAPFGVAGVLEHRTSLDQGSWTPLGPARPGLGHRLPWGRDLPDTGYFRMTTDPP